MNEPQKQSELFVITSDEAKVECLGKVFASDKERRDYFLERLREGLQELIQTLSGVYFTTTDDLLLRLRSLKQWPTGEPAQLSILAERISEAARHTGRNKDLLQLWKDQTGFPNGQIEDILRLSDPPYFTLCPNPFLYELISYYGKPYNRDSVDYRREPFAVDVSEGKSDAVYNAHGYHTKVPHRAIMRYILHYTEPNDVILDGFCGTGMTGIAAQFCGYSGEVAELKLSGDMHVSVGDRFTVLCDLSPIATFVSFNYSNPTDLNEFQKETKKVLQKSEQELGWMYITLHEASKDEITEAQSMLKLNDFQHIRARSKAGTINYTIWSDVFLCSNCGNEIVFWDTAVDVSKGVVRETFGCPHCGSSQKKSNMKP